MRFVVMRRGEDAGRALRVHDAEADWLIEKGAARPLTDEEHEALNAGARDMTFTTHPDLEDLIEHVGGGMYELPNGDRVKGKDAALARLAELEQEPSQEPPQDQPDE